SDGASGVYVGGVTSGSLGASNAGDNDVWLARYDGAGNQVWIRQIGSTDWDSMSSLASDGAGGVYACGFTRGSLAGPHAGLADAWLAHYDSAGNQSWIQQFGTTDWDYANGVSPDGSGGVFVCGLTGDDLGGPSFGINDPWLARYDAAGNRTWIRQFGGIDEESADAVVPDGSGGAYVSGYTFGSLGGPNAGYTDAWLARFDGAGNQSWIRQLGTIDGESVSGLALEASGGVWVSGSTDPTPLGPGTDPYDAWLAHYDGAGNQSWIQTLGTSAQDASSGVASDGSGGAIVAGRTGGSLGGPSSGGVDVWLARFDAAGAQTWIRQFGTAAADYGLDIAPAGSGGVFVSGMTNGSLGGQNAGNYDAWMARYDGGLATTRYCAPAMANSTTLSASVSAIGSNAVSANDLTLAAGQIPQWSFGFFLTSQTQDFVPLVGGSQGHLCLGGAIGRFRGAGQVMNSGTAGSFSLTVSLTSFPQPTGSITVQPGETWSFQAWYRDANPTSTSNLTDALSVTFH
ncbi:MAG: hypothetical protein ACJAQ3_003392, partial [Planctomycetota bacterium]